MKSELTLQALLHPGLNFPLEEIPFRKLTDAAEPDKISLASPVEIFRFRRVVEKRMEENLSGTIIIMVPEDCDRVLNPDFNPDSIAKMLKNSQIGCIFIAGNCPVSQKWTAACQQAGLPLFSTDMNDRILTDLLLESFHLLTAATRTIHGNMMDLFGVGILILGRSGIGKSECCLDLIMKGHRLVADDSTLLYKNRQGGITATASKNFAGGWMEIRGVGIIDVDILFGISALRKKKDLHLVVELMSWSDWEDEMKKQGRGRLSPKDLGRFLERELKNSENPMERDLVKSYFGIDIPLVQIPVGPGRSIANLIEVAARKQMLEFSRSRFRPEPAAGN
ncbi:MAG: hypothetical protein GXO69_04045 [Acidobacteria bacterium]|nr:hypothetical protein [Acidobacteriota bacterium]